MGYSPTDWDALPWHHQRMFLEGIRKEMDPEGEEGQDTGPETDGMEDDDAFGKALEGAKRRQAERGN